MTFRGEQVDRTWLGRIAIPLALCVATGACSFALGTVRAESEQAVEIQDLRGDVQKLRAMPEPAQVVTKDQLTEIVRRLDERTAQISQDVQYLRQHEERRER